MMKEYVLRENMKKNESLDKHNKVDNEIEKRLKIMEDPEYEFPERFNKKDYVIVCIVILLCLSFLIIGAFL